MIVSLKTCSPPGRSLSLCMCLQSPVQLGHFQSEVHRGLMKGDQPGGDSSFPVAKAAPPSADDIHRKVSQEAPLQSHGLCPPTLSSDGAPATALPSHLYVSLSFNEAKLLWFGLPHGETQLP